MRLLYGGGGLAFGTMPEDPVGHLGQALADAGERPVVENFSARVGNGDLVDLGRPVDACEDFELLRSLPPF